MTFQQFETKNRFSLQHKLVAGGILILLIPLSIVGLATFFNSMRAQEKNSEMELVQVAQSLSGMIQISVERDLRSLTAIASNPLVIRDLQKAQYNESQKLLEELYKLLQHDFEGIAIYDQDGILRADGGSKGRIGISIADREYFTATQRGATHVGSIMYSKPTGAPIFALSVPVTSPEGDIIGGIFGAVKTSYLSNYISSIKLGKTGYLFIVDQDGKLIAHPRQELLMKDIHNTPEAGILRRRMIDQYTGAINYAYEGKKKVAGVCPVPLSRWSIAVAQQRREIMSPAYSNMRFMLILGGVFVLLTTLALVSYSRKISIPVQSTLTTLNHAIDQATEAFLIIGNDGNVQIANPAALAMTECTYAEIINHPFPPDKADQPESEQIRKALAKGQGWNGHLSGTKKGGTTYTLDFSISPIYDPAGRPMCYLAVGRNITEELSIQAQLQQSQKMEAIGTLAGGIAHDFNNILSAIFGYTELALCDLNNQDLLQEYLEEILGSARRARDLATHILTFSRKANLEKEPTIPKYIIKDAAKLLRASLPASIDIQLSLTSSATILGNTTQIHQIIMNLGTNAGYAMKETGGLLRISLDEIDLQDAPLLHRHQGLKPNRYLQLKVADSGGGIPEEIRERIFDPFFTCKPVGEGTGLGLSVVHGIVKSLKGNIAIESEVGKGTTFTILLPIVSLADTLAQEEENQSKQPTGTERLLIVDDEPSLTKTMCTLLRKQGYSVHAFNSSELAWEAFSENPENFDLILTDYNMPRMNGIILAEKIRSLHPTVPIILNSGNLPPQESVSKLHPLGLVKKPTTSDELTKSIRKALRKPA